jgi:histidine phosphotransfer protein HptB
MDSLAEIDLKTFNSLKDDMGVEFLLEMLDTFFEDSRHQIEMLQSAFNQKDSASFARAAHSLKSTSLIFGAVAFANLARDLETSTREGQLETTPEKIQLLRAACEPLQKVLRNLCYG